MRICLAAGKQSRQVASQLSKYKKVDISPEIVYTKVSNLIDDILSSGTTILAAVDLVIIFDAAVSGSEDVEVRKTELLKLQDLLATKGFTKPVYYLSKDTSIYKIFSSVENRHNNFLYRGFLVMPYEGNLSIVRIVDTLLGKNDSAKGALHHEDFGKKVYQSREDSLRNELLNADSIIEDEIKQFGKNTPTSEFDSDIFIDNSKYLAERSRKEREQAKELKRLNNSKASKDKKEKKVRGDKGLGGGYSEDLEVYKRSYNIVIDDVTLSKYKTKIMRDYGLVGVSGIEGVGVSGVVSNMAESYALLNKKVAVLDLNLDDRKQTVYFHEFDNGVLNTLEPLIKGSRSKSLIKNSVDDLIDVFSISRSEDESIDDVDILDNFKGVVENLKEQYDIVLADIPIHLLYGLEYTDAIEFNSFLWVTENIPTAVEDLIVLKMRDLYSRNTETIKEILSNSFIIFNKYVDNRKGYSDSPFDLVEFSSILKELPSPYSRLTVVGQIPYTEEWEHQLYGKGIWVGYEPSNEGVVLNILGRMAFR